MRRLDPETWKRLAPLLDAALERPEPERSAYLDDALAGEPELRRILDELIEAEARTDGLLDAPAADLAVSMAPPVVEEPHEIPHVDGYEGLTEIGRGGKGIVYRAVRRGEGFRQDVALKVVRPGLDQPAVRQRFDRERSILARLEHPNIARLVDGGTTAEGRSFFAMEYVDGVPITQYADEHRLTIDARLRLLEDVCRAVSFAQQRLVVHRDLKPSNILVDTEGRVRLLDFGIARMIDPESEEAGSELTRDGARLLTPEYAAPEQLRGEPPSTATDVYALGVVLFELLSGRHPLGDTRAGALEFAMGMRASEWLGQAVDRERRLLRGDGTIEIVTASDAARARRLSVRGLRRALSGDLESIAAKALQSLPDDRYASAEALLADIVRCREGRPIEARAPSWRYRAGKVLQRHRTAVIAAALVVVALGVGFGVSVWQASVAAREAERAERAYEFLSGLFQDAHPDAAQGADWSASELLERGAERLSDAWPDAPLARGALQDAVANILVERGDYDVAARILRDALDREDTVARSDLTLTLARAEMRRGNFATADSLLKVLEAAGDPLAPDEHARLLASAASIHYNRGAYAEAESLTLRVLDFTGEYEGSDTAAYASDLNNLATYQAAQARFDEAEATYRRALAILDQIEPRPLSDIALSEHNLGDLYQTMQRHRDAIEHFGRAVALRRRLHPNGHDRLAGSLRGLAVNHSSLGELDTADSLLVEAAAMTEATLGAESDAYARALNGLAVLAYRRDDLDTARDRFDRANAIFETVLGPTHPTSLTVANNLATVQMMTGRYGEAEVTFRKVLERRREVLGERHPDVAFSHNSVGQVLRRLERPEEAVAAHREALELYRSVHGNDHPMVAETRTQLGAALREVGRLDESIEHIRTALAYREANLPAAHRDLIDSRIGLGLSLTRAGRWQEAATVLERAEAEVVQTLGGDSWWLTNARAARGLCMARLGRLDEGRALTRASYDAFLAEFGESDERTRRARELLAQIDE